MDYNTNNILKSLTKNLKTITGWILDVIIPNDTDYKEISSLSPKEIIEKADQNQNPNNEYLSFFSYKNKIIKKAIWLLKYRKHKDIGVLLGKACSPLFEEKLENWFTFENFEKPILIPIPLSKNKLKERGFNQCEIILEEITKNLIPDSFEYKTNILLKTKDTPNQAQTKNKKERLKNLKNCFSLNQKLIKGRNVIIFDDVITTGATTEEAKHVMQKAGAKNVKIISVAH